VDVVDASEDGEGGGRTAWGMKNETQQKDRTNKNNKINHIIKLSIPTPRYKSTRRCTRDNQDQSHPNRHPNFQRATLPNHTTIILSLMPIHHYIHIHIPEFRLSSALTYPQSIALHSNHSFAFKFKPFMCMHLSTVPSSIRIHPMSSRIQNTRVPIHLPNPIPLPTTFTTSISFQIYNTASVPWYTAFAFKTP